jgi:hypothetical protein
MAGKVGASCQRLKLPQNNKFTIKCLFHTAPSAEVERSTYKSLLLRR